jgi:hypothetical protein
VRNDNPHPHRRPEALAVVALLLLPLLFWWQLWAPKAADRSVLPEGDLTAQYYPLQLFAARELAEGRLPGWDPYLNAGQPGLADVQSGTFYPPNLVPNLVLALLDWPFTPGMLAGQVVFHFALASLFTYLFVRGQARHAGARRSAARLAGAVAALAFTFGGYLTSFPVQQLTILETAVWLPLVLFFLDRATWHRRSLPQILLAGAALALAFLAGHPQTAMYVTYATLAYALFLATGNQEAKGKRQEPRGGRHERRTSSAQEPTPDPGSLLRNRASRFTHYVLRFAYLGLLPLVIGAGLAAAQLGPTLAFIQRSTRAGLNYEAVAWGFPLAEVTHLLYPGYFGGSPQYVGILTLVLVAAALLGARLRRQATFWLLVGAAAGLLAFGGHTFLYSVAYLLLPGFGSVRDQERIIYLFGFAASVLAGFGALALVQPLPHAARKGLRRFSRGLGWVWGVFLGLTALFYFGYLQGEQQGVQVNLFEGLLRHHVLLLMILGGGVLLFALRLGAPRRRGLLAVLALGLIGLNLFTVNWRYNLAAPTSEGPFPQTGLVTFLQALPGAHRISSSGLLPGGASAGIVYQLEDTTGNTPLELGRFRQFEEGVGSWRRWQLLNVHYVLSDRDLDGPGLERVYEEDEVKLYRVGDPYPRAWIVHQAVTADDEEEALALLDDEAFDPREVAVLPAAGQVPPLGGTSGPGSRVEVVDRRPGRLALDVSTGADGLLVVSQPYYPGWQAKVDGERRSVQRVDHLLQGVAVAAGSHRVELDYRPSPLPALVSLVVLTCCLVAALVGRRTSREDT